jgi:hypothetical protein
MLKVAVIIFIIMLGYNVVFSVMAIIVPEFTMSNMLNAAAGKTLDNIQDAGYLKALKVAVISGGLFSLSGAIAGFFVLFVGFRKAQRWAWWALFISGIVGWVGGAILPISIGDKVYVPIFIIGVAIFLMGILLPIKSFFVKTT